jgi:amidase
VFFLQANSPAVQALLDAGAVLLGKTNLPLDLNDVQTFNAIYGSTKNPHNPSRTPGGSSGGSAAALAAGFSALELGGDIGGSIRTPAHCCGIFGHKSTLGVIPFAYGPSRSPDIVVKGPLARSADDLALAMRLLAFSTGPESRAFTIKLPECTKRRLSEFRVCIWADDLVCPVDKDVRAAVSHVVSSLKVAGCEPNETVRPALEGGSEGAFEV